MLKAVATLFFWIVFMGTGMLIQGALLLRLCGIKDLNLRQEFAQRYRLVWSAVTLRLFFGVPPLSELRAAVAALPNQFILICNHRSNLDPLFVFVIGRPLFFLSKKSVLKIPVIGWWMRLCGDVAVERGDKISRTQSLEEMKKKLLRGSSLLIFPEGTRQTDNSLSLGSFRDGAFNIAAETGVPIIALVLHSTDTLMGKNEILLNLKPLRYQISHPIVTRGRTAESLKTQTVEEMTKMIQSLCT